jgi:hypothetical protein
MSKEQILVEISRCDREIAEILSQPILGPAYLPIIGVEDWRWERRALLIELSLIQS